MFGVAIVSDRTSGRTAGRTSPRISAPGVGAGIEEAVSAPTPSVTSRDVTARGGIDSDGTVFVSRLSETGVATGGAGDGATNRCTTSGPEVSTRGGTDRSTAGNCEITRGSIRSEIAVSGP